MSRTIRRKNFVPEWVTHEWKSRDSFSSAWIRVPKEGKELAKALKKHHGDTYRWDWPTKWVRNDVQTTYRAQARNELARYLKDEEYEVIIPRKNPIPWD